MLVFCLVALYLEYPLVSQQFLSGTPKNLFLFPESFLKANMRFSAASVLLGYQLFFQAAQATVPPGGVVCRYNGTTGAQVNYVRLPHLQAIHDS